MIYIASDHGGFDLKNMLIEYLRSKEYDVTDMGPEKYDDNDDYPDYVIPAAEEVQKDKGNKAIVICRNGVGACIAANKLKGVRCALSWLPEHARSSRIDDNSNVLALPADYVSDEEAQIITDTWLITEFTEEPRHNRRLKKIADIEK